MALADEMESRGLHVKRGLTANPADFCMFNSFNFDFERLKLLKHQFKRLIHRMDGPVDVYRGGGDLDVRIHRINAELAHATIFQSRYSLEKHLELGLKFVDSSVIPNAVNPLIFNLGGRMEWDPNRKTRLITTSWSSNPNKGGPFYEELEKILDWDRFEWTFVGNTQAKFSHIRTLPALPSNELAAVLKQHDIYVIASLNEPCSNALLEALSCGLPAAYIRSGSHAESVKEAGLGFGSAREAAEALLAMRENFQKFQSHINIMSLNEVTTQYLRDFAGKNK